MTHVNIPIIIVSYCNPKDVVDCLSALTQLATAPTFDVFVCENGGCLAFEALVASLADTNGPCDEDAAAIYLDLPMPHFARVQRLRLRHRDARVIVSEATENLGYAGAVNAWIRVLRALPAWQAIWVLNPDTHPEPRALAELVAASASQGKGMVGSRIVFYDRRHIVAMRGLRWRRALATTKAVDRNSLASRELPRELAKTRLTAPSGVSIYATRQCLDHIGLMDEQYFLYFEDLDWGHRAQNACGVGYAHRSVVPHKGGTTIGSAASHSKASTLSVYLDFRNRVNFVRQHYPSWMLWTVLILLVRSLEYGLAGAFGNMRVALKGLRAGIRGETGRPDRLFEFNGAKPRLRGTSKVSAQAR
jgi:N-acetylglucosaminyl-diphospho-decaprenol L-rhamnosyltransferase